MIFGKELRTAKKMSLTGFIAAQFLKSWTLQFHKGLKNTENWSSATLSGSFLVSAIQKPSPLICLGIVVCIAGLLTKLLSCIVLLPFFFSFFFPCAFDKTILLVDCSVVQEGALLEPWKSLKILDFFSQKLLQTVPLVFDQCTYIFAPFSARLFMWQHFPDWKP